MAEFLVHESDVPGAATHALIVGVGRYPHLVGGGGARYAEHGGMKQLTSPPLSALALARWLASGYDNPDKPLASVALLACGDGPVEFTHPVKASVHKVEEPTFANVEKAARAWKTRGDSDPDNLVLFFFCGHGIASEPDLALLMQDFGEDPDAAMKSAVDFRRFHLGMERCRARYQCFFIDACRTAHADVDGYAGDPIFTPPARRDPNLPLRKMPAFYSTFDGETAQSRTGQVSLFTEAMLLGFKGGGADDPGGDWWVDTNQLQKTIQFMMERAYVQGFPSAQINPVDNMATFQFHFLNQDPEVPVVIGCDPPDLNEGATLRWDGNGKQDQRGPQQIDWDTLLPLGQYRFSADMQPGYGVPQHRDMFVRPPYKKILLQEQQP